jgi:hypothetical protein
MCSDELQLSRPAAFSFLAAAFHAKRSEHQAIAFNLALLALAVFVAYGRWFVHPL